MTPPDAVPAIPGEPGDPIAPPDVLMAYRELVDAYGREGVKLGELQRAVRRCVAANREAVGETAPAD